jgi:hypothetical protein
MISEFGLGGGSWNGRASIKGSVGVLGGDLEYWLMLCIEGWPWIQFLWNSSKCSDLMSTRVARPFPRLDV